MNTVNWTRLFDEVEADVVVDFCNGDINRRTFESLSGYARTIVRSLGANETRTRARKALRRRNVV